MMFAKIPLTMCRLLVMAVEGRRIHECRLRGAAIGDILNGWCRELQKSVVTDPIVVDGHRVYHGGHPSSSDMALGMWEPKTMRLMRQLLRPGMTFVDVGAHIGWHTLLAARAVGPTGHVFAFEPNPSSFDLLSKNVTANRYERSVILERKAICDASRTVSLFVYGQDSVYSTMYGAPGSSGERIEVEAVSLDQYFGEKNWPRVDLMKVDIEGAEGVALRGMAELSRRNPDLKLIIEYSPFIMQAAGHTPQRLFGLFEELGFRRRSIISWRLIPVASPDDIARRTSKRNWYGNLLCEKIGH